MGAWGICWERAGQVWPADRAGTIAQHTCGRTFSREASLTPRQAVILPRTFLGITLHRLRRASQAQLYIQLVHGVRKGMSSRVEI